MFEFWVVKDRIDNKLYELLFHQSRENRGDATPDDVTKECGYLCPARGCNQQSTAWSGYKLYVRLLWYIGQHQDNDEPHELQAYRNGFLDLRRILRDSNPRVTESEVFTLPLVESHRKGIPQKKYIHFRHLKRNHFSL